MRDSGPIHRGANAQRLPAPQNKKLDRLNESGLKAPGEIAEFAAILRKTLARSGRTLHEQELLEQTAEEMEAGNIAQAKLLSFKTVMAKRTAQWMERRDGINVCGAHK